MILSQHNSDPCLYLTIDFSAIAIELTALVQVERPLVKFIERERVRLASKRENLKEIPSLQKRGLNNTL